MSVKVILILFCLTSDVFTYKLSQVVIISRHNIRYPQLKASVEKASSKIWPQWDRTLTSHLTEKGGLLETYMGEYFSQWLRKEGLFEECPGEEVVVYTTNRQRTRETAKKFLETAFENCSVPINVKEELFYALIRNNSEEYKRKAVEEMQKKLNEFDLTDAYQKLNTILDIKSSLLCKEETLCDLTKDKDKFIIESGELPEVEGRVQLANAAVDAFLMSYYSGTPIKYIGWGKINNEDWETLAKVTKGYHEVRFNVTYFCKDLAKPLLHEMYHITNNSSPKLTLFVGHDVTLSSVMCALRFKRKILPNSLEDVPIGSKLLFQKWFDEKRGQFLLKINYVYSTTEQIRDGSKFSVDSPPNSVVMELKDCPVDENGFCLWSDFVKILEQFSDD